MSRREFTFSEGTSNKFWAIELDGKSHTVTFGRIGTAGQTQTKDFSSEAEAKKSYEKLIAEKTKKGYEEVSGKSAAPPATKARPAEQLAKATPKKAKAEEEKEAKPQAAPAAASANTEITHTIDLEPEDRQKGEWPKKW